MWHPVLTEHLPSDERYTYRFCIDIVLYFQISDTTSLLPMKYVLIPWKVKISYFCTYESKLMDISWLVFFHECWMKFVWKKFSIWNFDFSYVYRHLRIMYEISMKCLWNTYMFHGQKLVVRSINLISKSRYFDTILHMIHTNFRWFIIIIIMAVFDIESH